VDVETGIWPRYHRLTGLKPNFPPSSFLLLSSTLGLNFICRQGGGRVRSGLGKKRKKKEIKKTLGGPGVADNPAAQNGKPPVAWPPRPGPQARPAVLRAGALPRDHVLPGDAALPCAGRAMQGGERNLWARVRAQIRPVPRRTRAIMPQTREEARRKCSMRFAQGRNPSGAASFKKKEKIGREEESCPRRPGRGKETSSACANANYFFFFFCFGARSHHALKSRKPEIPRAMRSLRRLVRR
jgi:hypothetical protein